MRALKNIESAIEFTDGWLVHYNFFRPHSAIGDKTPAEAAGLQSPYKNWADVVNAGKPQIKVIQTSATSHHPPTPRMSSPKMPRKPRYKLHSRGGLLILSDGRKVRQKRGTII
jgi:hypothetical protein